MNSSGKIKTAEILISKVFLNYHSKAGEPTNFEQKIKSGEKKHTIRSNFKEWEKRLSGVDVLRVKQWSSVPYRSAKVKLFELRPEDGVELAKLTHENGRFFINDETEVTIDQLAKNDGLSVEDFTDWFKVFSTEPMALIYFSKFRY